MPVGVPSSQSHGIFAGPSRHRPIGLDNANRSMQTSWFKKLGRYVAPYISNRTTAIPVGDLHFPHTGAADTRLKTAFALSIVNPNQLIDSGTKSYIRKPIGWEEMARHFEQYRVIKTIMRIKVQQRFAPTQPGSYAMMLTHNKRVPSDSDVDQDNPMLWCFSQRRKKMVVKTPFPYNNPGEGGAVLQMATLMETFELTMAFDPRAFLDTPDQWANQWQSFTLGPTIPNWAQLVFVRDQEGVLNSHETYPEVVEFEIDYLVEMRRRKNIDFVPEAVSAVEPLEYKPGHSIGVGGAPQMSPVDTVGESTYDDDMPYDDEDNPVGHAEDAEKLRNGLDDFDLISEMTDEEREVLLERRRGKRDRRR